MVSRDLKPLLPGLRRISSPAALKVLIVLAAHADRQGRCWLSWTKIARLSGLSRRAVADGLRRLEEAGLVKRVGPAPRGRGTTFQLGPADGEPRCTRCTAVHQGGECSRTGVVHAGAPMAEVHAGAPSEGRNPLRTGLLAQDHVQKGGARPRTVEEEGDHTEGTPLEDKPPAGSPPASMASGEPAFGLDEHPGEATSVAGRWTYPALVDGVTLTDSGFADHLLSNSSGDRYPRAECRRLRL